MLPAGPPAGRGGDCHLGLSALALGSSFSSRDPQRHRGHASSLLSGALTPLEGRTGTATSRCKVSDAFSARYHSSWNGDVKWLPLSISYIFKNEMGCADAFRCLMGDTSVEVPLHALRRRRSKSIPFSLRINGKYFPRATSAWREEAGSRGLLAKLGAAGLASWSGSPGSSIPWGTHGGGQQPRAPSFRLCCLTPQGHGGRPGTVSSCCIQACAPPGTPLPGYLL